MDLKKNKKGVYFTLDAFFSTMLLLIGIILITNYSIIETSTNEIDLLSKDLLLTLSEIKISEVSNPWIVEQIANGNITNLNNSLLEQIGHFWALGKIDKATNLSMIIVENLVPERYAISIILDDDIIFLKNKTAGIKNLVTSRRMITGIEQGSPIEGLSASAHIRKIRNKQTSSYAYFGGFVGQGNITVFIDQMPADVNPEQITEIILELDAGQDFEFRVNGQICRNLLSPSTQNMTPMVWDVTDCKNFTVPDRGVLYKNNFSILFPTLTNNSYLAGGYVKVSYLTNYTRENVTLNASTYYFPEIEGVINLYDAFYIRGNLSSMHMRVHYFSNHTNASNFSTYIALGNTVVFNDTTSTSEQTFEINDTYLSSILNYSFLSQKTVPIRMSAYEYVVEEVITGGNADVILITDYSGSMKKAVSGWGQGNAGGTCEDAYVEPDIRRTELAVCLDNDFADIVLNYSGNRLWPVFIHDDTIKYYDDPENISGIKVFINGFSQGKGKTCVACAINKGRELLTTYSNESRQKFIVVMTDGVPTHCADGSCYSNSSVFGAQQCEGMCDTSGACGSGDIAGQCTQCTSNNGATNNTLYSANRSREDLNATIYSIGFGPVDDCTLANSTLHTVAEIGNGTYDHSKNVSMLKIIYETIAYDILERSAQISQNVIVGNISADATLFGDSKIMVNYTPETSEIYPNEISVMFQSNPFNSCTPTVNIPNGIRVSDARITSYSDEHWTDLVRVNNQTIFSLANFSDMYVFLGDPFTIEIPTSILVNGDNNISIRTGDSPVNATGCSNNNTLIYRGLVNFSASRSSVMQQAIGCYWFIEVEDGTIINQYVPSDYDGPFQCAYTNIGHAYKPNDAYDVAIFNLLKGIDYDGDGRIFFNLFSEDIEIVANIISGVPYMWGPSIIEMRVWQ